MSERIQQSGVIPYRQTPGGVEVLMVTSTISRRWLFPKGMLEPGLTPAESAEVEAQEEGGVLGLAEDVPVSTYTRWRGDLLCEVTLYPMRVIKQLKKRQWEEARFREREWVSLAEAERRLAGTTMGGVIADFRTWLSG